MAPSDIGKDVERTRELWRSATAVCFDVDSTVCTDECIDELARFLGKGEEVTEMTRKAMSGAKSFRDALQARLNIIRPSRSDVQRFVDTHPPSLTDGIVELVEKLHRRGVHVYLVSGGFTATIAPDAQLLNIPEENIFANVILFDDKTGEYAGFDVNQPTSKTGGKAAVCAALLEKHSYKTLVVIGDGATDMEACPPAHAAIGFGGNVKREIVMKQCGWFVDNFKELIDELQ